MNLQYVFATFKYIIALAYPGHTAARETDRGNKLIKKTALGLIIAAIILGLSIWSGIRWLSPDQQTPPQAATETRRQVEGGTVVGYINELDVAVWQGIPYAAAPVGALRWQTPQAVEPWPGELETLAPGGECASQGFSASTENNSINGEEDCLYLNVFVPADVSEPLPVMYWIHGGANTMGSGGTDLYDGSQLAIKHQVVVVTINYRLAGLGWFRHPALANGDPATNSGNFGTLDQIAGLAWVRDNISQFGGDPDRVTVFGESAGGWNTLAMMASPLAKGLFHRAIVQSGGLDLEPVHVAENYQDDEHAGSLLSSREIVNQLLIQESLAADRTVAMNLQDNMAPIELAQWLRERTTAQIFAAYLEKAGGRASSVPDLIGDGHVLPSAVPAQELFSNSDNYNAVPVILGTNLDEMKLFFAFNPDLTSSLLNVPVVIKDLERYNRFNRYSTDAWKARGVDSLAAAMREAQGDTVYAYRFDAKDLRDFGLIDLKDLFGAAHAFELPYVFGNFPNYTRLLLSQDNPAPRLELSASMMSYWANFAYTGSPGQGRDTNEIAWTLWQNGSPNQDRIMILDSSSGGGIRMSSERLSVEDIKQRLFSDRRFRDQEEYCEGYKTLFRGRDFVQAEYESLGEGGCS